MLNFNPYHGEFISGNKKIHLQFLSFLYTETVQLQSFLVIYQIPQCRRKTSMVHQTFVWWALYILYKSGKFLIRHLSLAIGNVQRFSPTLYHLRVKWTPFKTHFLATNPCAGYALFSDKPMMTNFTYTRLQWVKWPQLTTYLQDFHQMILRYFYRTTKLLLLQITSDKWICVAFFLNQQINPSGTVMGIAQDMYVNTIGADNAR